MHSISKLIHILSLLIVLTRKVSAADWTWRPVDALESVERIIWSYHALSPSGSSSGFGNDSEDRLRLLISVSAPVAQQIRIGVRSYELGNCSNLYRFLDEKNGTWSDIVSYPSSNELTEFWNSFEGSQWYTGERDWNFWTFCTMKSEKNDAINSVFRGETVLFNVGRSLPFAISSVSAPPTDSEMKLMLNSTDKTASLTRLIVEQMVPEEDRVMLTSMDGRLTQIQRVVGFIRLWTDVKYNYAFFDRVPDVNWDSVLHRYLPKVEEEQSSQEYYRLLQRLLAGLKDGHTVLFPPSVTFELYAPPIRLRRIEGKVVITDIYDELASSGLKPGMAITHVDDSPVDPILEESIYPYMSAGTTEYRDAISLGTCVESSFPRLMQGRRDSIVSIRVEDTQGAVHNFRLKRSMSKDDSPWYFRNRPVVEYERLEGDISYVALNTFRSEHVVAQFDKVFPKIRSSKGLIIDVRENGGAMSSLSHQIIGRLVMRPLPNGRWKSRQYIPSFHAWGKPEKWYEAAHDPEPLPLVEDPYLGPIVILAGPLTGSSAEHFLVPFQAGGRAVIVGEKTAGHAGNPLEGVLPGGAKSYIVTMSSTYPDGKQYNGIRVIPDIGVANTRVDVALGRDRVLETGLEVLKSKMK